MIKKILFLFFVVFAATAYSQDVTITGTVTDANSEPLEIGRASCRERV